MNEYPQNLCGDSKDYENRSHFHIKKRSKKNVQSAHYRTGMPNLVLVRLFLANLGPKIMRKPQAGFKEHATQLC
jgi:hypothetical protein